MRNKKRSTTKVLLIIFLVGLSLLLYPSIANYINERHSSRAISDYAAAMKDVDQNKLEQMMLDAQEFNRTILDRADVYTLSEEERMQYESLLNIRGDGIMGYIEIPSIEVMLPIYHGTEENVLQIATGHLDWTSLPVGGIDTHSVLSGHRGLPSAKLFTNLDKLAEGDLFMISVLDQVLTYEVDQVRIVKPSNPSDLQILEGEDYCTLVTCTPYGINSHRLLVRGRRVENKEDAASVLVIAEAMQVEPVIVSAVLAGPAFIIMLILMWATIKLKKYRKKHH